MTKPYNFQSMINALQNYWAEQGCLIWQPYYSQVGAGTWNPATFLRVLGPEPWNVAYVEPSVRPDDGRYGENPNRLQTHYQYQVILKPDPGNPQELYLNSLQAIGIDTHKHDIRFVEDNWRSPAQGAWGLGWEVWLDGLEITQFTYFQQAGAMDLDPVAVELTYGLDRIAAPLQGVHGFTNIQWNETHTFGDMNLQAEQEHSKYYFEIADIDHLHHMYELYEAEANASIEAGLLLPAYDYLIKLSHTFNVLDTRGAVGVTERQTFFGSMRNLAARIGAMYVEERQQMEYPWLDGDRAVSTLKDSVKSVAPSGKVELAVPTAPADFLFEIGTEELPASDLDSALAQLEESVPALLDELYLEHGDVNVLGTPRRLVVLVKDLAARQPDREELVKGPPANRAFGPGGEPTKAAEGFARSRGLQVSDLEVREIDGGEYAAALVKQPGRSAIEVLSEKLAGLIAGLHFEQTMRWNASNVAFSRPIRWLLALFGEHLIPFEYAGYTAAKSTRGLRFSDPETMPVADPADYFAKLAAQNIIVDPAERKAQIKAQVDKLAAQAGGAAPDDPALLDEVANLVEAPTALLGSFDKEHLKLPREVLISVMRKHQRYFPVEKDGALLPHFITVANGRLDHQDVVTQGNESVVWARFADAAFFVKADREQPLTAYIPELDKVTFQKKLGSMLDKAKRITALVADLAGQMDLNAAELKSAVRAAELCKADLVTSMVVEMTSLQGIMGKYYALDSGEPQDVAEAIGEHYLPTSAGGKTPVTKPGLAVGLADRLDSLVGLFAAGLAPTGNKDPFALRRAALGLVQNLIAWELDFDLRAGITAAAKHLPIPASTESQQDTLTFIVERARNLFLDEGYRYDVVDAVLAGQGYDPASAAKAVKELQAWVEQPEWETILPAYARCVRITRDKTETYPVDAGSFVEDSEKQLFAALEKAEAVERQTGSMDDFIKAFTPMMPAIDGFFENVLVMAEDEKVRQNRLGLLQRIAALADGVADLSRLEGF